VLVKCKCHNNKIERDAAYKVVVNNKNEYYCNEYEYLKIKEEKENRINTYNIINDIFGYVVINTILFKEINEISKVYSYTKIYSYIKENLDNLNKFMNKNFNNEYGKIKYFTTIIKNNLKDYIIPKREIVKISDSEIIENKYSIKPRRKSIEDYIKEME